MPLLTHSPPTYRFLHTFLYWARRVQLARNLALILTISGIISGIATYISITGSDNPLGPDPKTVMGLVLFDLIALLTLTALVFRRVLNLWSAHRRGFAASRLQTRIILLFSLVSLVPTLIVATFSVLFFNYGIQSWFNERVATAIDKSVAVAEAYLGEHKKIISSDAWSMAAELNRNAALLMSDSHRFRRALSEQVRDRNLASATVFQGNRIIAQSSLSFIAAFDRLPVDAITQASRGQVVVITDESTDDRVGALIKLEGFIDPFKLDTTDVFLLVGRFVDSKVIDHIESTKGAANEYQALRSNINKLQIQFSLIYVLVAFLLLLAATWFGMLFAGYITRPLSQLIAATEKVKEGDLEVRVQEGSQNHELGSLGRAFNRMTEQLARQRQELISANIQIDERRRFIETVLAGVSAGIIALDPEKRITLFNRSALSLLATTAEAINLLPITAVIPEVAELVEEDKAIQQEVPLIREGRKLTLMVRITPEINEGKVQGYIITFDDITELLSAQRTAAWADVARRIAHEVKNPLTPIHLAAERLKRKYAPEIQTDRDNFLKYTDMIMRHTGDIGNIIEEFAHFARMPAPLFQQVDLLPLLQEVVFSQECTHSLVHYETHLPANPVFLQGDPGQLRQILINLLKNAAEAFTFEEDMSKKHAAISVTLTVSSENAIIEIQDNGSGFPQNLLDRLTEPYVTTKSKGTGLGLAIVKKIVDDHGGELHLENNAVGAFVRVVLRMRGSGFGIRDSGFGRCSIEPRTPNPEK